MSALMVADVVLCVMRWPAIFWPIVGVLAMTALVIMAVIAVLVYYRLQGVNLAAIDYEFRQRREQKSRRIVPYGRS